jgi:hypothetical protein
MADLLNEEYHFPSNYNDIQDETTREFIKQLVLSLYDMTRDQQKVNPIIEDSHTH